MLGLQNALTTSAQEHGGGRTTNCEHSPSQKERASMLASGNYRLAGVRALLVASFAMSLVLVGCLAGSVPSPPPKPAFQWEPPSTTASGDKLAIAIVDARLTRDKLGTYRDATYLSSFNRSLGTDLQRALVAKGLKVTGPFDDLQNMTFPEKKGSDLALIPRIYLEIDEKYSVNTDESDSLGRKVTRQGQMSAHGFVELTLVEPMSEQKMWVKKVDLPSLSENISVNLLLSSDGSFNRFAQNTDNRDTALINMLNESYPRILDTVWRYLDAEEISHLASEAKDARRRKGY